MSQFDLVMSYNFHVSFVDSSHVVVDPNGLLGGTEKAPAPPRPPAAASPGPPRPPKPPSPTVDAKVAPNGSLAGAFQECTGLDTSLEVEEYKEGGMNDRIRKFASRVTWTNIVLKRGIGMSDDLWNWHAAYMTGNGKRRDGIIVLEDDLHNPIKMWHFTRGLPVRWTGPTFNAKTSDVAIESIEIAHEGITLASPASPSGGPSNVIAVAGGVSASLSVSLSVSL